MPKIWQASYIPEAMATRPDVRDIVQAARERRRRVPATIRMFMRLQGVSDADLAAAFGFGSRQAINHRLTGRTAIAPEEIEGFAAYFGVEPEVLYMDPADALRWVIDNRRDETLEWVLQNRSDLGVAKKPCFPVAAA